MLIETALIKPYDISNLVVNRRRPSVVVPAGGALVGKESGVEASSLKHITNDGDVLRGGLLVRHNVCVFVLPHLSGGVGLPFI